MNLRTEKLALAVAGAPTPMPAYLAAPERGGPFAPVIVLEEIFGVNGHIRDVTERVAREGYVAIAPDIHHRDAPGQELDYSDEGRAKGRALVPKLTVANFLADFDATVGTLRARADVRPGALGVIGFCIGGHLAYLAACMRDVSATASFYGGGIAVFGPGGGEKTVEHTAGIKGRILCLFGAKDPSIPPDQIDAIRRALESHGIRHEVVIYPEATHGFFCDQRSSYDANVAADAWRRVKELFGAELVAR